MANAISPAPRWRVQITEAEFVGWWYGQPENYDAEPDQRTRMNRVHKSIVDWAYDGLPDHRKASPELAQPVELDRLTSVAWRFMSWNGHDTYWKLAESREAALEAARAYAEDYARKHPMKDTAGMFLDAMEHVEEVKFHTDFDAFVDEMIAAKATDATSNEDK